MAPPGKFESLDMDTMFRFIETIQLLPCLWDRNSDAFNNPKKREHRAERKKAYAELLGVLRKNELHKDATIETAKYMVKSLFSSFQTQHLNLSRNPEYQTKIWYPSLAAFLLSHSDNRPATPVEVYSDEDDLDDASTIRRSSSVDELPDINQTDSNLPGNKADDGKCVLRPVNRRPSSSGYSSGTPDTSINNAAISSPQAKRSKCDSSLSTSSSSLPSTSTQCSVDEAFGSYIMTALRSMKQDQISKAKVEIFQILERGLNGHL